MPATSERRRILQAFVDRLETIHIADGFETDAGDDVAIGDALELGEDDPDQQLLIVPGEATKRSDGRKTFIDFDAEIQALVKVGLTDAWLVVEAMGSDIQRAVENDDTRLIAGYPIEWMAMRTLERQPGSQTAGVGITYRVVFAQPWGHP